MPAFLIHHAGTIIACAVVFGFLSLIHSEFNRKFL